MLIKTESYLEQSTRWPTQGRHIMAQFDQERVVVYQAYRPSIGLYAVEHQRFGGEFSFSRMSWIKPNFLWMMFRSGWGTKPEQEVTLAIHLQRSFFDSVLAQAVPSTFDKDLYHNEDEWRDAIRASDVRLQWDPDHDPHGKSLARRAIQLGLRDAAQERYGREAVLKIEDISDFVTAQRKQVEARRMDELLCPSERRYVPAEPLTVKRLKLTESSPKLAPQAQQRS